MLGPLDNETVFKKAFTDKIVFKQFVKDIVGIDIEVDKIETEKKFKPKASSIDIKLDIFAESIDKRIIIEIQRIDYDYNFDRFLNYFLSTIIEQQKSSKQYVIDKKVYSIVVLTMPYTINKITGEPIQDEVLIQNLDPENLEGKKLQIFGHKQFFLNPHYRKSKTPKHIKDWLDLIYVSLHKQENYHLNLKNKGIKRAIEIIDYDNIDDETLEKIKITEGIKAMNAIIENKGMEKGITEGIKKGMEKGITEGIKKGLKEGEKKKALAVAKKCIQKKITIEEIMDLTGLSKQEIEKLKKEIM